MWETIITVTVTTKSSGGEMNTYTCHVRRHLERSEWSIWLDDDMLEEPYDTRELALNALCVQIHYDDAEQKC